MQKYTEKKMALRKKKFIITQKILIKKLKKNPKDLLRRNAHFQELVNVNSKERVLLLLKN